MSELLQAMRDHGLAPFVPYVEHPIEDAAFLKSLRQRASAFECGGQPLPCSLVPALTYDLGTRKLNSQLVMSVIDTNKSPALMHMIGRKLAYEATTQNTGAAFVLDRVFSPQLSKKLGKPVWRHEECVIVVRVGSTGTLSQHILTPGIMKSIVLPTSRKRKIDRDISALKVVTPCTSQVIRGLNDRAIAWNGSQWGRAEILVEEDLIAGDRAFSVGKLGQFQSMDTGQELRVAMARPHAEYADDGSGLVMPGERPAPNQHGFRDWFMVADTNVLQAPNSDRSYSGPASGPISDPGNAGTGGGPSSGCESLDTLGRCLDCCKRLSDNVLNTGLSVTGTAASAAGLAVGVGNLLAGFIVGALVAIVGVVISAAVAYAASESCLSGCDAAFANRPATSGGHGVNTALS